MAMQKLIWLSIAVLIPDPAFAEFYTPPQQNTFSVLATELQIVEDSTNLSEDEALIAKVTAAGWFYIGPCKGHIGDIAGGENSMQVVLTASPKTAFGSALLQMIATLIRVADPLGRNPSGAACDFAKAMATMDTDR